MTDHAKQKNAKAAGILIGQIQTFLTFGIDKSGVEFRKAAARW